MAYFRPSPKGGKPYRVFKPEIEGRKLDRRDARKLAIKLYRAQKKAQKKGSR